jgi:hypothetical protein
MVKIRLPFILQCLVFLIPVNIYVIGDWMCVGMQWALFRYQQSSYGNSLISIGNDLQYLHSGLLQGRTVVVTVIWIIAVCILILCLIVNLAKLQKQTPVYLQLASLGIIGAGLLFTVADLVQYSVLLHSNSGFCIPIGVPLILAVGWWGYRDARDLEKNPELEPVSPPEKKMQVLNVTLPDVWRNQILHELALLVFISILIKFMVSTCSVFSAYQAFTSDIGVYYSYALSVTMGQIPYIDFTPEYPQFFFIPAFLAFIPSLFIPGFATFTVAFKILMYIADIATLICIYFIAIRLFGAKKAFLSGLLYATAFSSVFFVPLTYDIFPTFFLILSLLLFVYARESAAYVSATAGVLTKWFPVFCLPYFVLHTCKNGNDTKKLRNGIILSAILVAVSIIPFIFLDLKSFLNSYLWHINRASEAHSLIFYLDSLTQFFFHFQPWQEYSLVLMIIGECALIIWYFRYLKGDYVTLVSLVCLSLFFFDLVNKVATPSYIIWFTPLLALLLINSKKQIILFYMFQLIMYLEAPVLLGIVYEPGTRYTVLENSLPSFPLVFFTIKFAIYFVILAVILRQIFREGTVSQEEISCDLRL